MADPNALCTAVTRVLAASASHLQLNMLMLEDDSETPVQQILTLKSRSAGVDDDDVAYCRITAEKVYSGDDSFTPVKVYPIGNLGDYQCNSESDLQSILDGDAAHPTLAEVTVGDPYDIPEESRYTYEDGYTMGWEHTLEVAMSVGEGS